MAYTDVNFKTKMALKEALKEGKRLTCYDNTPFGAQAIMNGNADLEGPHYPEPHRWYATAKVENGIIVKVS